MKIIEELLKQNLIKKENIEKIEEILRQNIHTQVLKNDIEHVIEIENFKGLTEEDVLDLVDTAEDSIDYSNYNEQIADMISKLIESKEEE